MTISYLAGKRLSGLSTDEVNLATTPEGTIMTETDTGKLRWNKGGWKELGRTTLGGASATIDISGLANKRYLMVLASNLGVDNDELLTFNGITTSTYARRFSANGGADGTSVSQANISNMLTSGAVNLPTFGVGYIANYSTAEKLLLSHVVSQNTTGATTAPTRLEGTGKHAQTTNPISQITQTALSGTFYSGSELVVLGWDPTDVHTTNFWEQLADASWSSGGSFNTGTFTTKKYLWVQGYVKYSTMTGAFNAFRVGNGTVDTGTNYARRNSLDGGADGTAVSRDYFLLLDEGSSTTGSLVFFNIFIINIAGQEKLGICHQSYYTATGATNAPKRTEVVGKWDNTSNQINIIEVLRMAGTGDYTAGQIKVWGSN